MTWLTNPEGKPSASYRARKLGEVCEIISPGIEKFDGAKKYVATADVDFDKIVNFSEITYSNRPSRANMEAKEKDVLVARMAETQKFLVVDKKFQDDYIFSTGFVVLRTRKDLLPKYLFYFLTTKDFNLQKNKLAVGATQKAINNPALKRIKIPLPPLKIQKKIVERLDAIKKAQELNDKQIALAAELFQSLLHRELDPRGKGWEVRKLGEVTEIIMGQSPPSSTYNTEGRGLPFFQGKFEFGEIYPIPTKYCFSPIRIAELDDILISVRAPVGNVNLAKDKSCIGRGLAAIRAMKGINQIFLYFFLKMNENNWSKLSVGSTFSAIRRTNLENLKIPLPPIKTQRKIVEKLSAVQDYKKKLLDQKALLKELFESVLNKSMKGGSLK